MHELTLTFSATGRGYVVEGASTDLVGESGPVSLAKAKAEALVTQGFRLSQRHVATRDEAERLGREIFDAVFRGRLRDAFIEARAIARRDRTGLRLLVKLDPADPLFEVPWELLHDGDGFLATDPATPVVRYVKIPRPLKTLRVEPPLRVLVTTACPPGQHELDLEREVRHIRTTFQELKKKGKVELVVKRHVSLSELVHAWRRARARGRPLHVWHHCGHGALRKNGELCLVLEEEGKAQPASVAEVARMVTAEPELRAVILNACLSASGRGLAPELGRLDVPFVIGFRAGIFDESARTFVASFYEALLHAPADVAVNQARHDLFLLGVYPLDWAQPIVISRNRDPVLVSAKAPPPQEVKAPSDPSSAINPLGSTGAHNPTIVIQGGRYFHFGQGNLIQDQRTYAGPPRSRTSQFEEDD